MENSFTGHSLFTFEGHTPVIAEDVFVAPTASIIGRVTIAAGSSVWFGSVLRGDIVSIEILENTNIQDGVIIHGNEGDDVHIGSSVTVGHGAIIHGCHIGEGALIGMGAVVLDGAVVEPETMVAAGAVVTPGTRVTGGNIWAGCPAKPVAPLTDDAKGIMAFVAEQYWQAASRYRRGCKKVDAKPNTCADQ